MVALIGQPAGWKVVHDEMFNALQEATHRISFNAKQTDHRRGQYGCLGVGISFGGGQQIPGNLVNTPRNSKVLQELLGLECFKRMAGFADSKSHLSSFPLNILTTSTRGLPSLATRTAPALQGGSRCNRPREPRPSQELCQLRLWRRPLQPGTTDVHRPPH